MCVHPIDISEDALMPTIDPREFGLVQPAYDIADEEVKRGVGNPTTVYKAANAAHFRAEAAIRKVKAWIRATQTGGGGGMILEKADTASPYGQDDGILTERVRSAAAEMRVSDIPNGSDPDGRRTMKRHNMSEAV